MTSRNEDVLKILNSREIAERQRQEIRAAQTKRSDRPRYLETGFVRSSTWPANRR